MAYLGIDVGTEGARAGLFDVEGALLGSGKTGFSLLHAPGGIAEYHSAEIWQAVCAATREAVQSCGFDPAAIQGIGVDAACSMVIDYPCGHTDGPDVIAWLDHRAVAEAEEINQTGAEVLNAVGQRISPEMQVPKLLWLQRHQRDDFDAATAFYDLCDWLTYRMTGATTRSLCTSVCKWTYRPHHGGWDRAFFEQLDLGLDPKRVGTAFKEPGAHIGNLLQEAAGEMGLSAGCPVGAGLIDAYAGAAGTLSAGGGSAQRLALIAGTSACHIVLSDQERPVPGVWGPYPDVLTSRTWALEAGQSACGALIDVIIGRHPAGQALMRRCERGGLDLFAELDALLEREMAASAEPLTARRHIIPDILGNRAPIAEPDRLGAVVGFGPLGDESDLARDYLAALQSLALGTRHILDVMGEHGVAVDEIVVSGSLKDNAHFLQQTADATGLPVLVPATEEPVLLGASMLGRAAADHVPFAQVMQEMRGKIAGTTQPTRSGLKLMQRKYRVFRKMLADQAEYDQIMQLDEG